MSYSLLDPYLPVYQHVTNKQTNTILVGYVRAYKAIPTQATQDILLPTLGLFY